MKYVVFGPYPPMPGDGAAATFATVTGLLGRGVDPEAVTVVSPRPSGAHYHADPDRLAGALRLARWIRSADAAVVHLDRPPRRSGGRSVAGWAALGVALRGVKDSTVHLGALGQAPDGRDAITLDPVWVRCFLAAADRVVVTSDADAGVVAAAGVERRRVQLAPPPPPRPAEPPGARSGFEPAGGRMVAAGGAGSPAAAALGPWHVGAEATREELQAEIERRAAVLRRGGAFRVASAPVPAAPVLELSRSLRAIAPLGPAPARSAKPGFSAIKRVVAKLVGWQVNPIIEQVNRLQAAIVDAFEALEAREAEPRR